MTPAIYKIFLLSSDFKKRDFEKNASQSQLAVTATAKYIKIFCYVGIFKILYLKLYFVRRAVVTDVSKTLFQHYCSIQIFLTY